MGDYAVFDPSTGQPSVSVTAPGERLTPAGAQRDPYADWRPNEPDDGSYDLIGDEIAPPEGEVPPNIVASPAGPFSRISEGF